MYRELFISYSHYDKEFVQILCRDLQDNGISYFLGNYPAIAA